MKKVTSSKTSRMVKMTDTATKDNKVSQARNQAKKIMQGLYEAEQNRTGKIEASAFEDYFRAL